MHSQLEQFVSDILHGEGQIGVVIVDEDRLQLTVHSTKPTQPRRVYTCLNVLTDNATIVELTECLEACGFTVQKLAQDSDLPNQ